VLASALRHGILHEREAEFVTDALRAALLSRKGYETKVLQSSFSTEQTHREEPDDHGGENAGAPANIRASEKPRRFLRASARNDWRSASVCLSRHELGFARVDGAGPGLRETFLTGAPWAITGRSRVRPPRTYDFTYRPTHRLEMERRACRIEAIGLEAAC